MSEWTDIGEQLRKARESKGLDIRDVAHTTRIPIATLEALEQSDYSIFPSPSYARSFLSQYSDHLGVDAHEWVDAFETGNVLSNVNDHGYLKSGHDHVGGHRPTPEPARRHGHRKEHAERGTGSSSSVLQTMTVFIVTALLIGGGIYAYKEFEHLLTGSQSGETAEAAEAPPKSPENPPETSAQPAETPTADQGQKPEPAQEPPAIAKNDTAKETTETTSTSANTTPPSTDTEPTAEKPSDVPELIKPTRSGKPPKAMVVEE
ncbi:hypothetical protein CSB20_10480 [bacterium DOLZORAL124_64_63]|nr:MAG: hypothetical protein CSB20_10480 [bacterium DOLZORAL124_64_63]PIE21817.1 MAG: hypothetical protein CSA62_15565 [Planctomycetota bacterium]